MKKITILFVLWSFMGFGQDALNNYKYIIVPTQYGFQKSENQYRINTRVKKLFTDRGFTAVYSHNIPLDLQSNPCSGLRSEIKNNSGLFTTKLLFVLRDCQGIEVFKSKEGRSKQKEFEKAFKEAIQDAFTSFDALNYKYAPREVVVNEIKNTPKNNSIKEEVPQPKKPQEVSMKNVSVGTTDETLNGKSSDIDILYAQPIGTGYQLVDSTPKIRFVLLKTGLKDVFLVKNGGLVYKQDSSWIMEYYKGEEPIRSPLNIKF